MNSNRDITADGNARVHVGNSTNTTIYNYPDPNRCLADLRLADPREEKIRIEHTKGGLFRDSYKWILDNGEFRRWQEDKHSRVLWIKGNPGKGKTMLLCGIVNELSLHSRPESETRKEKGVKGVASTSADRPSLLSFFLCQATDARLNTAVAVLRGLIYHLLCQERSLVKHLQEKYEHGNRQIFDGPNAFFSLAQTLLAILHDPSANNVCLIVDALDECETGILQLLDLIVQTTTASSVKWIVSSRNRRDVEQRLCLNDARKGLSLELNDEHVSQAVNRYIRYKISMLVSLRDDSLLRAKILKEMLEKSNGTFLWAALVVQQLEQAESWDMLSALEQMPSGMTPLYDRMLNQIGQLDPTNREVCRLVLSTVTVAFRPLQLQELGVVSNLPQNITANVRSIERVVGLCGSFLTVRKGTIYLVHQSAKDYLTDHAQTALLPVDAVHSAVCRGSLETMSVTLRRDIYDLRHPGTAIEDVTPPIPDPLTAIRYSCSYWADHFYKAVSYTSSTQQSDLYNLLRTFLEDRFLNWLEALSLVRDISKGILAVESLHRFLQDEFRGSQLDHLVQDLRRFVLSHRVAIETGPLQTYVSALIFSPTRSLTRQLFQQEEPRWIVQKPIVEEEWDACITTLEGHSGAVESVAFSPDGRQLASASWDYTVKLWDATTGRCTATLEGHSGWVWSVAFSADGRQLASASDDNIVKLWDAATGRCTATLEGHSGSVGSVAFSADGRQLASASWDHTVKLWDVATGCCTATLEGHSGSVGSVAFSPDGRQLASASNDNTVKLWDAATGCCIATLEGHSGSVWSVAFSADGRQLASASWDHTVKLWDAATGRYTATLEGHSDWVRSVAFSPDGRQLASASDDNTVKLWDAATGRCIVTLEGHSGSVWSVAFSPDGRQLASASWDHTVKLWDTATGRCIATIPVDRVLRRIAFDATGNHLNTKIGSIDLSLSSQLRSRNPVISKSYDVEGADLGYGISEDSKWVTYQGRNLVWLPSAYRPYSWAVSVNGTTVGLGCASGRVWFLQLSTDIRPIASS